MVFPAAAPLPALCAAFTGLLVLFLLIAEARQSVRSRWLTKPFASLGFVALAWSLGATQTAYGQTILVGLVLAALGDVLLIPHGKLTFLGGLLSFLAGHVAYGIAFWHRGVRVSVLGVALAVLVVVAVPVSRWLLPKVERAMKGPVLAYMLVITAMLGLAVATYAVAADWRIPVGAGLFYLSDLSVARDRFVAPGFLNRLWGLPVYYAAQLLLAWSVLVLG